MPGYNTASVASTAGADASSYFIKTHPHLRPLLSNPAYTIIRPGSRVVKRSTEDSFFAETLQTHQTIKAALGMYRTPDANIVINPEFVRKKEMLVSDAKFILEIGEGLNGFPKTAHGGLVASILDEVIGFIMSVNYDEVIARVKAQASLDSQAQNDQPIDAPKGLNGAVGGTHMTAYLNVRYHAPLETPGVVVAHSRIAKKSDDGRKVFLEAWIENAKGTRCASAEALFVEPRARPTKL